MRTSTHAAHSANAHRAFAPPLDPREVAYELTFEMIEMLMSRSGSLRHELVGFETRAGVLVPGRAVGVDDRVGAGPQLARMLQQWPIVVRVFQGWACTEHEGGDAAGGRHEVILIAVHTPDSTLCATCRIDRSAPHAIDPLGLRGRIVATLEKGALQPLRTH